MFYKLLWGMSVTLALFRLFSLNIGLLPSGADWSFVILTNHPKLLMGQGKCQPTKANKMRPR